jgi:glutamate synthase (ferredoxin)
VIDDLDTLETRSHRFRITNSDLAIGAHLSGEIARRRQGANPSGVLACEFTGTAGQSFGSFLVSGVKLRLRGQANDYVGKGLSGGGIAITAGEEASQRGDVLVGNTALYGATSGELFVAGRAGERFAVRNSGALAVVEGVGQHGCEYMTAGIVLVLGPAGLNFGAGMTGGLAYVLRDALSSHDYNTHSVQVVPVEAREELWLRMVLRRHFHLTNSPRAWELLRSDRPLPLLRVEPLQAPSSSADTWASILSRLRGAELNFDTVSASDAEEPLLM